MLLDRSIPRLGHLQQFYSTLELLEGKTGKRLLRDCHGRMTWPARGVYFFFENTQNRFESGNGSRVIRVGTHALKAGSQTTLWKRLSQHKGQQRSGGGNHRGSIFRKLVGHALMTKECLSCKSWGQGNSAPREIRESEVAIEKLVSEWIGNLPFLWLDIGDNASPDSVRGIIERNSIALLSNSKKAIFDAPTHEWLGNCSDRPKVKASGLWNQNHTDENYDPRFLDTLEKLVKATPG